MFIDVLIIIINFFFQTNADMNAQMPFAVVGSTDFVRVGNKMVRARQYPWGTVQGTLPSLTL